MSFSAIIVFNPMEYGSSMQQNVSMVRTEHHRLSKEVIVRKMGLPKLLY